MQDRLIDMSLVVPEDVSVTPISRSFPVPRREFSMSRTTDTRDLDYNSIPARSRACTGAYQRHDLYSRNNSMSSIRTSAREEDDMQYRQNALGRPQFVFGDGVRGSQAHPARFPGRDSSRTGSMALGGHPQPRVYDERRLEAVSRPFPLPNYNNFQTNNSQHPFTQNMENDGLREMDKAGGPRISISGDNNTVADNSSIARFKGGSSSNVKSTGTASPLVTMENEELREINSAQGLRTHDSMDSSTIARPSSFTFLRSGYSNYNNSIGTISSTAMLSEGMGAMNQAQGPRGNISEASNADDDYKLPERDPNEIVIFRTVDEPIRQPGESTKHYLMRMTAIMNAEEHEEARQIQIKKHGHVLPMSQEEKDWYAFKHYPDQ